MVSTSSSVSTISAFLTSMHKNRPKVSLPTMILRTQIPMQELELLNQANLTSEQLQVQEQMVSHPCQVDLREALGANKLFAGQDLNQPLKQRRVVGTMSQLQRMKYLEKVKTIKQVMILGTRLNLQEYQLSQHHLTSIHLVMVHLNNL